MNEGWVCPVCGRGNAPWVKTCNCTRPVSVPMRDYPEIRKLPETGDPLPPPTFTTCKGGL
jgi:hypothetical protein